MGDLNPVLGIICGLKAERRALGAWVRDPRVMVAISAARPDRAEAEAERLVARGCRALLSWGLAGGLDPGLVPGDLVTASTVVAEDGAAWETSLAMAKQAICLGADRVILTPAEKADLHRRLGAGFVDMESHRVARVARKANRAAYVLRVIADPAGRALPNLVVDVLDDQGAPQVGKVLASLTRRPQDILAIRSLKRDTDTALKALTRAANDGIGRILAETS